ncbi:PREDICTED: 4-nitrophenylphosphatase-like isoform X2 [Bactrocera latifrons]|uniref:4-nitrophenylphosphatase-like isoform X2 n=1 Tax=Bactrocera latifrons TaxID=174628 RepID=UPI0008DC68FD|nr:PREDICTED: 4-nitrophenylphosphatase-like isoform X2 [Bactrocera latifrons]
MSARKVRHILNISAKEQREFVNSFDVVMCDCDGVMWMVSSPLPRTGEAVNALKDDGKLVYFVSNNSERPEEEYVNKFIRIGVKDFQANHIMYPAKSMLYYIKKHNIKQPVFSTCSADGNDVLRRGGVDVRTLDVKECVRLSNLIKITEPEQKMGAVLFDVNCHLNFVQMTAATRYLADKDCDFLMGAPDPIHKLQTAFNDFYLILKRLTGREAIIVGKPAVSLGEILKDVYKLDDPKRCLFVGDSMDVDIPFGRNCGFQTLLVLSGSTPIEEMWQASAENQPHFYADSMADFIELYANINKNA